MAVSSVWDDLIDRILRYFNEIRRIVYDLPNRDFSLCLLYALHGMKILF